MKAAWPSGLVAAFVIQSSLVQIFLLHNLCSVLPNSVFPSLLNSQLVSLQPVGIFNKFSILFTIFVSSFKVSPISTAMQNTVTIYYQLLDHFDAACCCLLTFRGGYFHWISTFVGSAGSGHKISSLLLEVPYSWNFLEVDS